MGDVQSDTCTSTGDAMFSVVGALCPRFLATATGGCFAEANFTHLAEHVTPAAHDVNDVFNRAIFCSLPAKRLRVTRG